MKRRRINWLLSDILRPLAKAGIEWSARLRGKRLYCAALAGESEYDLTINCDLTVSCSCQDYDGSGHLGDLTKQSFREVFFGAVARRFREELAKGKLPLVTCARCGDLRRVSKASVRRGTLPDAAPVDPQPQLYAGPLPHLPSQGILLENTVNCNIDCIGCDRQQAAAVRSIRQMTMANVAKMAEMFRELRLRQLFFLNQGEPFLSPHVQEELGLLRRTNPDCHIVISTNGIVLNTDAKRAAALHASHVFFSIAGVDDAMLRRYERLGSFDKAYANLKALVDYRNAQGLKRPLLEWKYLLFNWNDRRVTVEHAIELARAAGADAISFWPTNNPFYGWSWRYRLGRFDDVGESSWKGREVDLRAVRDGKIDWHPL
jgi:hypothetical protein